ncbi:MAG: NAD(P)/FAD-dependent oxidoreductase, partial [Candidatus Zixiibacteriota bacterium]
MSETIDKYEIVIVGGGPGGMTAGLYCARANRPTALLEKYLPGGQIANTDVVDDYPGFEMVGGQELAEKMANHARKFGLEFLTDEVTDIWCEGDDQMVSTASGKTYRAKVVILSPGGTANKLGVPGEDELYGRGVTYCALCDGAFFKGQVIAVVGGGDAAVEEAAFLTKYGSKVYIIHRRDEFRAQKVVQARTLANPKIEVIWDTVVEKVNGEKKLESVTIRNVKTGETRDLEIGGLFPLIGFTPNSDITREKMEKDGGGHIITNDRMETSIPGIYACGDVRSQL